MLKASPVAQPVINELFESPSRFFVWRVAEDGLYRSPQSNNNAASNLPSSSALSSVSQANRDGHLLIEHHKQSLEWKKRMQMCEQQGSSAPPLPPLPPPSILTTTKGDTNTAGTAFSSMSSANSIADAILRGGSNEAENERREKLLNESGVFSGMDEKEKREAKKQMLLFRRDVAWDEERKRDVMMELSMIILYCNEGRWKRGMKLAEGPKRKRSKKEDSNASIFEEYLEEQKRIEKERLKKLCE